MSVHTIDCSYAGFGELAAAYLVVAGDEVAIVETNTGAAVPRILDALAAVGRAVEDVRWIVITHVHLDHAGGAGQLMRACPNATLLAHPKAAKHAIDPSRIIAGATAVYGQETFDLLYGEVLPIDADRVEILGDGETRALGDHTLTSLHTRGHANHHLVLVDDVERTVFTGDSFGLLYPRFQANGVLALPSTTPTDFDAEAAHASVDRIAGLDVDTIHPTHFGAHTGIAEAAAQLHALLTEHAAVVDEADTSGRDGDALDAFCLGEVQRILHAHLDRHHLGQDAKDFLAMDIRLNAQGLAFAVRKRRYKRGM